MKRVDGKLPGKREGEEEPGKRVGDGPSGKRADDAPPAVLTLDAASVERVGDSPPVKRADSTPPAALAPDGPLMNRAGNEPSVKRADDQTTAGLTRDTAAMKRVGVALYGFGTVGMGVQRVIRAREAVLREEHGVVLGLRHVIVRDTSLRREVSPAPLQLGADLRAPLRDPGVGVVVEAMGGVEPARTVVAEALRSGRSVVTANKALIASHGAELEALARARGVQVRYEAAVAGAVPILSALRSALVGNRISRIRGILNGTCNYILSRMASEGLAPAAALREAQALGFAEADPGLDLSGIDSAQKLLILARHAFGEWVNPDRVRCRGIESVSLAAVREVVQAGAVIRLVAEAVRDERGISLSVAPVRVEPSDPLHGVRGVENAIVADGDFSGPLLFAGPGAGGDATASAMYADLVELARAPLARPEPVLLRRRRIVPLACPPEPYG